MIKVDDLEKEISSIFDEISTAAIAITKKAVDKTAKETNAVVEKSVTFKNRTGEYVKAFKITTLQETKLLKVKAWHVAAPHHRLTHLLEKGHATRDGGRTRAYPHISKGADYAEKRLEQLITEGVSDLG